MSLEKELLNTTETVISVTCGIGSITGIFQLYNEEDYYGVHFPLSKMTNYYPVKSGKEFRKLSSKKELEDALSLLSSANPQQNFSEKKERIAHFKSIFGNHQIDKVSEIIISLESHSDLSPAEKKLLDSYIDSFTLELSYVHSINQEEARKMITESIESNPCLLQ